MRILPLPKVWRWVASVAYPASALRLGKEEDTPIPPYSNTLYWELSPRNYSEPLKSAYHGIGWKRPRR